MNIFIVIFCIGLVALFICLKNRRRSLEKNLEREIKESISQTEEVISETMTKLLKIFGPEIKLERRFSMAMSERIISKVKASKDSRRSLRDLAYNAEHLLNIFSKIRNDSKNNILEKAEKIKFNLVNWKIMLNRLDDYSSIFSKKQQI